MLIFYLRYDIMLKAQQATIQDKHYYCKSEVVQTMLQNKKVNLSERINISI